MRRVILKTWCVVLSIVTLLVLGCASTRRTIEVQTEPPGATLLINGYEIGATPASERLVFRKKDTRYRLVIRKPGYEELRLNLTLDEAKRAHDPWLLSFTLEPLVTAIEVQFNSTPDGATVRVGDSKPIKTPGILSVEFKRKSAQSPWSVSRAEFSLEDYTTKTESLSYESMLENPIVSASLYKVREEMPVDIVANVEGALVKVNGKEVGTTPIRHVFVFSRADGRSDWATYLVEVGKEGHRYRTRDGDTQPQFTQTLDIDAAAQGRINVKLEPIEYFLTPVGSYDVTSKGIDIRTKFVLSKMGEIEKEPRASAVTRMTDADPADPLLESRVSVMPNCRQIVYTFPVRRSEEESPAGANIWMLEGNAAIRMTDGEFFDIEPAVTADGKWIYFSSDRLGRMNIWRMMSEGKGGLTKITDSPSALSDTEPSIAPDGARIAYTSILAGSEAPQIWFANADGSLPTQIRSGRNPAWSPDGQRLAYVVQDPVSKRDKIWVMDENGANPTQLTSGTDSDDRNPVWSHDGNHIVYASDRALNEEGQPNFDIWMMNADGSGQTQLTVNGSYDSRPSMSADGKHVYFISNRGARHENQETLQIWRVELLR